MDEPAPNELVDLNRFGLADSIFGSAISQNLAVAVGLVAMLGAIAEHKVEDLWVQLSDRYAATRGPAAGPSANITECRKMLAAWGDPSALAPGVQLYRTRAVKVLEEAVTLFESRNEIVHRVWSVPYSTDPSGYKSLSRAVRKKRIERDVQDVLLRRYDDSPRQLEFLRRTIASFGGLIERLGELIGSVPPNAGQIGDGESRIAAQGEAPEAAV